MPENLVNRQFWWRGGAWLAAALVFVAVGGYFLHLNYGIFGQVSYKHAYTSQGNISEVSTPLYSADRDYRRISTSDVYFDVVLPRRAEKINFEIGLENLDQDLLYLSLEKNDGHNNIVSQSNLISSSKLDNLSAEDWEQNYDEAEGVTWWQKKSAKLYENFSDLIADSKNIQDLVYEGLDEEDFYSFADYEPASEETVLTYPFRGSLQFLTYANQEDLSFSFVFEDKNTVNSKHDLKLILSRDNEILAEQTLTDTYQAGEQNISIFYPQEKVSAGVYTLQVEAGDNIFFSKISTLQRVLALTSRFKLAEGQKSFSGYLFPGKLSLTPIHEQGVQTVTLGKNKLKLAKAGMVYDALVSNEITQLTIPKNDVVVDFDGLLVLNEYSKSLFIDKNLVELTEADDLSDYDYIITKYDPLAKQANIYQASFDLENIYVRSQRYVRFHLYLPNWQIGDMGINLRNIKVTYETDRIF